jgi:predicted ATP-dependent Lon-type protease
VRQYDLLLMGGLWAQIDIRHEYDDEARGKRSPFWINDIKPIQVGSFDLDEYCTCRRAFDTNEWVDLLLRSIGLEPVHFSRRLKLLLLTRLVPLCEPNYNLVELGPRGTGKSYAFQEISPYAILMTGPTTVANLFYNMATNKIGLVGIWDAIAFDEVADLQKMPREVITTLKTYGESGTFARGKESLSGLASLAMFGNTNQPVEAMVRSSHLFLPLPDVIREDMAFLDRIHFYLPGWEIPKMRVEFFTEHYGFVVDYLVRLSPPDLRTVVYVSSVEAIGYVASSDRDATDVHVEAIDLLTNHVSCDVGIVLVVAIYSALKKHAALPGLLILGDLSIQGNIKAVRSLAEPLQVGMDNGARRALIPLENKRHFLAVSGDIVERVDPVFFSDPMTAALKALGMT